MSDASVDKLIRKSLPAQTRRSPGPCINENLMAAYLEKSLSPEERSAFESHLADCSACQEVLAVSLKLKPGEDGDFLPDFPAPSKKTLFRFSIPIPAIGALLVCIAVGAVFFRWQYETRDRTSENTITTGRVADLRPPRQMPAQVTREFMESRAPRTDAGAPERARSAMSENKPASPSQVQPVTRPPHDGIHAIGANNGLKQVPKREAESMMSTEAGAAALLPAQESEHANARSATRDETDSILSSAKESDRANEHPALRDEMAAISSTAPLPMAALPAGEISGAESAAQAKNAKGEGEASIPKQSADAIVPARTQEPFSRPPIYAASNRIATTLYETGSVETSLRFAIKNLSLNLTTAESRKIGTRIFYNHRGYWIDEQCREHPDSPIVELTSGDPQYEVILKRYPGIRSILPAAIFWEAKNYLLK